MQQLHTREMIAIWALFTNCVSTTLKETNSFATLHSIQAASLRETATALRPYIGLHVLKTLML
jgi:hypothetical protein